MPDLNQTTSQPIPQTEATEKKPAKSRILLIIFALIAVTLIAGVVLFFVTRPQESDNEKLSLFISGFKKETLEIKFSNPTWKDILTKDYDTVLTQKDKKEQFATLSHSFGILLTMYGSNLSHDNRKALEDLRDFLKENYKEYHTEDKFKFNCIDSECNLPSAPQEISKITSDIEKLTNIDPAIKESALNSMQRAKAYNDKRLQVPQYDAAFLLLKNEYEKNKSNKNLKDILVIFNSYIKDNFTEEYNFILKNEGKDHFTLD